MPEFEGSPDGRSQFLSSGDTVTLDSETFHEIKKLIEDCQFAFAELKKSEIFITSLDHYLLSESEKPSSDHFLIGKSLLLVNSWFDAFSSNYKAVDVCLQQIEVNLAVPNG